MKLCISGSVKFLVLVVAINLAGQAEGNTYCFKQLGVGPIINITTYGCYQSKNYMADLEQAPTSLFAVTFGHSDIPVLKNRSFARFTNDLTFVGLHDVGLKDMEPDAFQGATGLVIIALMNNKLEVIKGEWFRDLPDLMTLSVRNNLIHTIEGSFFTITKTIDELDLYGNKLTTLPHAEFEHFNVEKLSVRNNPWTEESFTWLATVIHQNNITEHDADAERNMIGDPAGVTKESLTEVTGSSTTTDTTEGGETNSALTNVEINSKDDFCKYLRDHENPFYVCDMEL